MKKKVFKPSVQRSIELVSCIVFVCLAMIDDFEWQALPFILGALLILIINTGLLNSYGKY